MKRIALFLLGLLCLSGSVLAAGLVGVTSDELQSMLEKGAVVVDVRTPQEWKTTGVIPGSHPLTFFDSSGQYDKTAWLKSLQPLLAKPDQPIVLVCRSGNRSAMVGQFLTSEAGFDRVYHLEKGIREWSAEGRSLAPPCPSARTCSAMQSQPGKSAP